MEFTNQSTRDSQKVRGNSQLRSHLLNAFKSYFIFRKDWFHSLNNAYIKKISAVVPKITEFEYTWGSLSVPRQFWESTSSKFCKKLAFSTSISSKPTTPQLQAIAYVINTPSETCMQWHFAGKCVRHKNSTIKNKHLKHEHNLLTFIGNGVVRILADFFKQRFNKIIIKIIIHRRNTLHDHIKWAV